MDGPDRISIEQINSWEKKGILSTRRCLRIFETLFLILR